MENRSEVPDFYITLFFYFKYNYLQKWFESSTVRRIVVDFVS